MNAGAGQVLPYFRTLPIVPTMKTTLILPDTLVASLKQRAAERDTSLSALVAELLRRGLDAPRPRRTLTPLPTYRGGRPLVDLNDRDALYCAMEEG